MAKDQNPYDFIMNPEPTPKLKLLSFLSGNSKKQRVLIALAGAILLILIMSIVLSFLFRDNTGADRLKLAQQHTELLRVSELGERKARNSSTKNLATTVKLTLQSTEDQIVTIAKKDQKVSNKQIGAGKDIDTDKLLTQAEQTNRFDEAFTQLLQSEIREYLAQIKIVYDGSNSSKDKKTLNDLHAQLNKLLPSQNNQLNQ